MVTNLSKKLLRAEGLLILAAAVFVYAQLDAAWWLFILLFFVPDVCLFGYLRGPKWGSYLYNFFHTYLTPAAVLLIALVENYELLVAISIIWIAHIGFDRALGYDLKPYAGSRQTPGVVGQNHSD